MVSIDFTRVNYQSRVRWSSGNTVVILTAGFSLSFSEILRHISLNRIQSVLGTRLNVYVLYQPSNNGQSLRLCYFIYITDSIMLYLQRRAFTIWGVVSPATTAALPVHSGGSRQL